MILFWRHTIKSVWISNTIILSKKWQTLTGIPVPQKGVRYTFIQFSNIYPKLNKWWIWQTGRQWTYQTCVEFGFFQSSDLKSQPFGQYFPVDFFIQQCADIFGPKYNLDLLKKSVEFTNNFYGGFDLKVRNVIFPNGSIDPWHVLGILQDLNEDSRALLINGTAHCADMYPESDDDPPQLRNARIQIMKFIRKCLTWLFFHHNYLKFNSKGLKFILLKSYPINKIWINKGYSRAPFCPRCFMYYNM